ncbi:MAG: YggS family pyridoxal phosphate-dependent enzyme [Candidatus Neomarinimicrobiota bacterium]
MILVEKLASIQERIEKAQHRSGLNSEVILVAVTKNQPITAFLEAQQAGLGQIGENRVQEAAWKFPLLEKDFNLTRRMIGHLQSNKVNKALDLFHTIDSVDSLSLAQKINKRANLLGLIMPVLLEINTSGEIQKNGFSINDIEAQLACRNLENLRVDGLMTVGPLSNDENTIRTAFKNLRELFNNLNTQLSSGQPQMQELSMGMSSDFEIAIEEGSTMIRLGTELFGPRKI